MSTTFQGTYTKNRGAQVAAGTVAITPLGGSTSTQTLDNTGSYSVAITTSEDQFSVVETITGGGSKSYTVEASPGTTVDTSRDVGKQGTGANLPAAAHQAAPVALTSSQNATAAATDLATTEALANSLQTAHNQLQADVAALRTAQAALITALQNAGILAAT